MRTILSLCLLFVWFSCLYAAENNNYVTPEQFGAKGDGITDDTEAVQAALDYGRVKFSKKKYYCKTKLLLDKPSARIIGNDGCLIIPNTPRTPLFEIHCNDAIIENLRVTSNVEWHERTDDIDDKENFDNYWNNRSASANHGICISHSTNVTLKNCTVSYSGYGILIMFSNNIEIDKCKVHHTMIDGIATYHGSKDVYIHDCVTDYTGDDSYPVFASLEQTKEICERVLIKNNVSNHCGARPLLVHGASHVTYENNIIKNNRLAAIEVLGVSAGCGPVKECKNIVFLNNMFEIAKPTSKKTNIMNVVCAHNVKFSNNEFKVSKNVFASEDDDKYLYSFKKCSNISLTVNSFQDRQIQFIECDSVKLYKNKFANNIEGRFSIASTNVSIKDNIINTNRIRNNVIKDLFIGLGLRISLLIQNVINLIHS